MLKISRILFLYSFMTISLFASTEDIIHALNLVPGQKAIIQWQRVFKSKHKMKRYGIDKLSQDEQKRVEKYLMNHAADSDQPTVAGM